MKLRAPTLPLPTSLGLGGLTLLAFVLRLANIDQSLFQDELRTYGIVTEHTLTGVVPAMHDISEVTPPLHFLLAWASAQLGDPTIWIRLPSLLSGTATVPVVYLIGRRTAGSAAGLLAAALVALSPFAIFYSTEARGYATMVFLVALSTLALLHALEKGAPGWWIAYTASACAALYTHYTAVFVIVAQAGWAFWVHRDRLRTLVIVHVGIVLGYLPWLPGFFEQRRKGGSIEAIEAIGLNTVGADLDPHRVSPGEVFGILARLLPGHPFLELESMPGRVGIALVALAGSTALVAAVVRLARNLPPWRLLAGRPFVLIVILALATPLGLLVYAGVGPNLYTPRNMSASIPALAIFVGALLTSGGRWLAPVTAALVLAAFGIGAVKTFDNDKQRPAYRELAHFLNDATAPGDRVVDQSRDQLLGGGNEEKIPGPLSVYLERLHTVVRANESDEAAWQGTARGGRVFLVRLQAGLFQGMPPFAGPGQRFVLRDRRTYPGLARVAVGRYQGEVAGTLEERRGHSVINWSLGKDIDITRGAARGLVDDVSVSGRLVNVQGWAIDGAERQEADWVLAFSGKRLLAPGRQGNLRPDLAKIYGTWALVSGFTVTAETTRPNKLADPSRLRVFAVVGKRASELRFSKKAAHTGLR